MTAAQIAREFTRLKRMQRDLRLEEEEHRDHPIAWQCRWLRWLVANRMQRLAKLMRYGAALLMLCGPVLGQDVQHRHHPPQDMPLHEKFYSNWYMPDQPGKLCCNKVDCYPTEAKFERNKWWAKRREDGKWLAIPYEKVERNREMPDPRAHLCAPPPTATHYPPDTVFCFGAAGGT